MCKFQASSHAGFWSIKVTRCAEWFRFPCRCPPLCQLQLKVWEAIVPAPLYGSPIICDGVYYTQEAAAHGLLARIAHMETLLRPFFPPSKGKAKVRPQKQSTNQIFHSFPSGSNSTPSNFALAIPNGVRVAHAVCGSGQEFSPASPGNQRWADPSQCIEVAGRPRAHAARSKSIAEYCRQLLQHKHPWGHNCSASRRDTRAPWRRAVRQVQRRHREAIHPQEQTAWHRSPRAQLPPALGAET